MNISVENAKYIRDYKVEIFFNDNTSRIVDFEKFLTKAEHPVFNQYKDLKKFEKFKIELGNLVWGKDWDLIFPIQQLYNGKIKI